MLVSTLGCSVQDLATFGVFLCQDVISDHFVLDFFFELMLVGFEHVEIPILHCFWLCELRWWRRGLVVRVERTVERSGEIRFSLLHVSEIVVKWFHVWHVELHQLRLFLSFRLKVLEHILIRKFLFDGRLVFWLIYLIRSPARLHPIKIVIWICVQQTPLEVIVSHAIIDHVVEVEIERLCFHQLIAFKFSKWGLVTCLF